MEAVQRLRGCPRVMRGDLGTENVRGFQHFLLLTQLDILEFLKYILYRLLHDKVHTHSVFEKMTCDGIKL